MGLWVVDNRDHPNDFPELRTTFARMICGPRRLGVPQFARAVQVTHAAPAYRDEYARVFGVPVTFDAERNAVLIDESLIHHRVQAQPRYVFGILSARADALLKELENSKSTRGRVESLLLPVLHTGEASMETIAAKLALSRQTLFRKLKAEGTSFEKIHTSCARMAPDYLGAKKVSVNEAAYPSVSPTPPVQPRVQALIGRVAMRTRGNVTLQL